jgi:hypothetical protein
MSLAISQRTGPISRTHCLSHHLLLRLLHTSQGGSIGPHSFPGLRCPWQLMIRLKPRQDLVPHRERNSALGNAVPADDSHKIVND